MNDAELELICFDEHEIMTTSHPDYILSNMGDGIANNVKITSEDSGTVTPDNDVDFYYGNIKQNWAAFVMYDGLDSEGTKAALEVWNGTYSWNGTYYVKQ